MCIFVLLNNKTNKDMDKKLKIQITLLTVIITVGIIIINNAKSKVNYILEPCPICGSSEVLDCGYDNMKYQEHSHCVTCNRDFYIDVD